jgi:catechol 2,3-dioxygenase-like lactoylglutathione lyase family enzyme
MNVVLQDFDASVAHFRALYGAEFMVDIPQRELHAGLVEMGRVIFELFVPHEFLLNARYGAHYVGIEYQANMDEARAAVAAHNMRIVRDIGLALHTHPADGFGIAFEFYDGYFHDRDWPLLGGTIKPAQYWRDAHALGLTGQKGYSVAVRDLDAARAFFQSFLSAKVVYEAPRPAVGARAIGLQVADGIVELIAPVADGILQQHLHRFGEGIRSTIFGVKDIARAKQYFADHGINPVPGDAPNTIAVPAEANLGVIFEFAE